MKHWHYLKYLIRHKWFVMLGCFKRGLYVQGIVHDWSKFLPSEWFPYAESFYGREVKYLREMRNRMVDLKPAHENYLALVQYEFDVAWLKHINRQPHHWQFWVLLEDDGGTKCLKMPEKYRLEMLADWEGAGRAITGKKGGTLEWYTKNRYKQRMHDETRAAVDADLKYQYTPEEVAHLPVIESEAQDIQKWKGPKRK